MIVVLPRNYSYLHFRTMRTDFGWWIILESGERVINIGHFTEIKDVTDIMKILSKGT